MTWDEKKVDPSLGTNVHQTQIVILIGDLSPQDERLLLYWKFYLRTMIITLSIGGSRFMLQAAFCLLYGILKSNTYFFLILQVLRVEVTYFRSV